MSIAKALFRARNRPSRPSSLPGAAALAAVQPCHLRGAQHPARRHAEGCAEEEDQQAAFVVHLGPGAPHGSMGPAAMGFAEPSCRKTSLVQQKQGISNSTRSRICSASTYEIERSRTSSVMT